MERKENKMKRRRPVSGIVFFLTGIFIICLSLMLSNCGESKQKSIISDGGAFAIDLSLAPAGKQGIVILVNPIKDHPSLDGTELTVEAWVKSKTATLNGSIYSRLSSLAGIALYVKDNIVKFTLRLDEGGGTGTDYIAEGGAAIGDGEWHHVASVLIDADHGGSHGCSGSPHIDIYIDGVFAGCADVGSFAGGTVMDTAFLGRMSSMLDGLGEAVRFDGIIDEVRIYRVAKTEAEINETKDRELTNGEIESDDLIGYWRNNVGKGSITTEYTGGGYNGTIMQCPPGQISPDCPDLWDGSWAAGDWP